MKNKILLFSDHPLSSSGVGTQARWLINGLIETGRYSFKCFGAAVKHNNYDIDIINDDFIIKPIDGFGTRDLIRHAIATEQPDCVLLFTDPRFFIHIFEMEDEIHSVCPIAYNHLWDNPPWPEFNRVLYESCDLINCINKQTFNMLKENMPTHNVGYIPHAVPNELYFQLTQEQNKQNKIQLLGQNRADHFIALFVSRNARRKRANDLLVSWRQFIDQLQISEGHSKATLLMHTDPFDQEGPNLHRVIDQLKLNENVVFSNERLDFQKMNVIYNLSDVVINVSLNEGFGLSLLEAKMAAKPLIAVKTGGMIEQVFDDETGTEFGCALEPDVKSLVGNQMIPYIYEDYVSHKKVTDAIMKMYKLPQSERERIGNLAQINAQTKFNIKNTINDWDISLTKLINDWKNSDIKRWNVNSI